VSLYLDSVSVNYSFIVDELFVLARTIYRHHSLSLGSSEWVNKQIQSKIDTTAIQKLLAALTPIKNAGLGIVLKFLKF